MNVFFFFQAEDGIRDLTVTGVQTCALPISRPRHARAVLLHGHPSGRAGGAERARRGPRLGPGEGAREGEEGAARPRRRPGGPRAAPLLPPARRGGARGNARRPGGVRGAARTEAHAPGRAARDQAVTGHAGAWPRSARALAAPLVRHAPARRGRRLASGAGAVGSRLALYHAGVYSYIGGTAEKGVPPGTSPVVGPHPLSPRGPHPLSPSPFGRGGTMDGPSLSKGERTPN